MIRKREHKSGTVYVAIVFRGKQVGPDGKEHRQEHSKTFRLKKDAIRWEREQKGRIERREWLEPSAMTLNQYLDQWEEGALKLGAQRDRTKASYRALLKSYVRPRLGAVKLADLDRLKVEWMAGDLLKQTKTAGGRAMLDEAGQPRATISPVTVRRTLAALSVALGAAVKGRLLLVNPAQGISVPRGDSERIQWLTREQVNALVSGTQDDRHGVLWMLLAYTGLRPGEALGLGWAHVDLDAGTLRVERSLTQTTKTTNARGWTLDDPKTRRSRRTVPMPDALTRALRAHRARQAAERLEAGEAYADYAAGGFVFARPDGAPLREDSLLVVLHRALARLELPKVSLYSLRHAAASLRLHAGVSLKVVSELLGHASIVLTADTYSHVTDQLQQAAADQFSAYMTATPASRRA